MHFFEESRVRRLNKNIAHSVPLYRCTGATENPDAPDGATASGNRPGHIRGFSAMSSGEPSDSSPRVGASSGAASPPNFQTGNSGTTPFETVPNDPT
jgi:hypothetical protein